MGRDQPPAARAATQPLRRPPTHPRCVHVAFHSDGQVPGGHATGPIELTIEATSPQGELAPWFDDLWWTELVTCCAEESVTVHLAPTPGALLHPVVLHQLDMVFRVAPRWRVVGQAFRDDIAGADGIELLARSPFHEVRVIDGFRNPDVAVRRLQPLAVEELFAEVMREQRRIGARLPVLVRLPARAALAAPTEARPADAESALRAAGTPLIPSSAPTPPSLD
ncbi:MAG: hypothetical protein HY763_09450 [Planctomycetes bacterium]|nr:hypothetical protein [Planctomycetota bacterium]